MCSSQAQPRHAHIYIGIRLHRNYVSDRIRCRASWKCAPVYVFEVVLVLRPLYLSIAWTLNISIFDLECAYGSAKQRQHRLQCICIGFFLMWGSKNNKTEKKDINASTHNRQKYTKNQRTKHHKRIKLHSNFFFLFYAELVYGFEKIFGYYVFECFERI